MKLSDIDKRNIDLALRQLIMTCNDVIKIGNLEKKDFDVYCEQVKSFQDTLKKINKDK